MVAVILMFLAYLPGWCLETFIFAHFGGSGSIDSLHAYVEASGRCKGGELQTWCCLQAESVVRVAARVIHTLH